ncbi:hypothetical protein [Hymenobacter metallicola]|uniref:Uncharacterized protein n=1 Tax=Hymenobacter metallicola TaxID=2563114 RepID=A0A4Z0PYF7_9BACT|nr:hypothetical protein [Hymenobacter metallicola]TGE22798.1 hypothetical protein E5K02_20755 [Hymenobacter metallicola]
MQNSTKVPKMSAAGSMQDIRDAARAAAIRANRITVVVMVSLLLAQACHRKAFTQSSGTKHTRPAWKRTSLNMLDKEQANPSRL